jgi:Flp pilus assembly pilin Flp
MLNYVASISKERKSNMLNFILTRWPKGQKGQDLAEYGLLIGLIALAVILGVQYLGGGLDNTFRAISDVVADWAVPAIVP